MPENPGSSGIQDSGIDCTMLASLPGVSRGHLRIDVGEGACVLEQYMFLDQCERVQRMPIVTIPRMMKI